MSGNTIGGIAGGLIGFAITGTPMGAQWGWMIGSVVGGIVDPQTIQGAQWQNQQLQGSSDGLARAIVLGTNVVTGNLLDAEPGGPRIGKVSESGKGGPEVERDTAILTYAIEICDSSELRGTSVRGVIAVWENEKLVYDVRPDENGVISGERAAASSKWLANKKFYFGGEDQEPPAELVAIHGIGNVPAYRGTCLMAVLDEDLMVDIDDKPRGSIPTYRFLVSQCEPVLPDTPAFLMGGSSTPGVAKAVVRPFSPGGVWAGTNYSVLTPDTTGATTRFGCRMGSTIYAGVFDSGIGGWQFYQASVSDLEAWADGPTISAGDWTFVDFAADASRLWIAASTDGIFKFTSGDGGFVNVSSASLFGYSTPVYGVCLNVADVAVVDQYNTVLHSADSGDSFTQTASLFGANRFYNYAGIETNGDRYIVAGSDDFGIHAKYSNNLISWSACSFPSGYTGRAVQVKWLGGYKWMIAATDAVGANEQGFLVSFNDGVSFAEANLPVGLFAIYEDYASQIGYDSKSGVTAITGMTADGVVKHYRSANLIDWVEFDRAVPNIISNQVFELNPLNQSGYDGTPIPDADGYYVDQNGNVLGPELPVGTMCSIPLDQAVRKLHKIGAPQLADDEFDLTALEGEIVRGYTIQDAEVTVATACDPLRKVWTFDLPAYDGKVRAIKRGRAVDWELSEDDLVAMDSGYEESVQDESLAFPLKMHLAYTDPVIDYKETTQTHERYSADARVAGEEKVSMGQLVMSATEAKQAVVKTHKTLWANIEDTRKLSMPIEYIHAVNSDTFTLRNKRYRIDQMRVEGLQVVLESAAYDRISSYQSSAIGVDGTPGPGKLGTLRGPTISAIMNLPVLRPEDDGPGVYWAATGVLNGWDGAKLQISRYGGNYVDTGISTKLRATIGELEEVLPLASRYGMSKTTEIKVKLNKLATGLGGTDMLGLLRGDNAAAILRPDGTAEIIQFLTATETSPGKYTLGGILRGRLNTAPAEHLVGAKFVLLDGAVTFVPLRLEDSDTDIGFRAVSNGTTAESNIGGVQHVSKLVSMIEWAPGCVRADTSTGDLEITFSGRGRIGSSRIPVHSANFKEYRITVLQGTGGIELQTRDQFVTIGGLDTYDSISIVALSDVAATFNSEEGTT